jgi:hypothetical protein
MLKLAAVVVYGLVAITIAGPIEVVCDEFGFGQCEEMRSLVEAVESKASEIFSHDFSDDEDGALIELHLQLQDYYNADERLNSGRFRKNWSFANSSEMQAHIALQPPVPTELLEAAGIPVQTKLMIGQCATHLLRYRAFPNHCSHPKWFTQGMAVYVTQEAARSIGMLGSSEDEPYTSTHIVNVLETLEEHTKIGIETILNEEDIKDVSTGREYAMRGLMMFWLEDLGVLQDVINEARRLGGGDQYEKNLNKAVVKAIAEAGVEDGDSAFRDWLGGFSPKWHEQYRSLQTSGEVWMQGAFSRNNSVAWNSQELGERDWEMTGSFQIFDSEKTQMNILLGKSDAGYISIALGPEFGVTVFYRKYSDDGKKSSWIRLIHKDIKSIELNEWSDFKVSKRRDRMLIRINKDRAIRVELGDYEVSGPWGLGVQNKSAGLWRDVEVDR